MRRKWIIVFLIFAFAGIITTKGQIVTVKAEFEFDSVLIGKQLLYTIRVESAPDVVITMPEYRDTISSEIEILSHVESDTVFSEGKRILTDSYLVTSFHPGWNTLPPQPVAFNTGIINDTAYTTALLLTVLAPAVDTTQAIMPIKPPINTPLSLAEILPWLGLGILVFLAGTLIAALVWIRRNRVIQEAEFNEKPKEPAHIEALKKLEELKKEELTKKGALKEYYSRLSEIVRIYISRQFEIHAMESTTTEILEAFSVLEAGNDGLMDELEGLLMLADLVKFAKGTATEEENLQHLENAVDFVRKTYPLFLENPEESTMSMTTEAGNLNEERHG